MTGPEHHISPRGVRRRRGWRSLAGVLLAGLVLVALPAAAARDDLDLVSRATGGAPAADASREAAIAADGARVAFESAADNLSADDVDSVANVFLRDVAGGTTTLVSRAAGLAGAGGDGASNSAAVSADGLGVAFRSGADNLSAEDSDAVRNIFVRDVAAATTGLVSRATGAAGPGADGDSGSPSLSADASSSPSSRLPTTCRPMTATPSGTSSSATSWRAPRRWRVARTRPGRRGRRR